MLLSLSRDIVDVWERYSVSVYRQKLPIAKIRLGRLCLAEKIVYLGYLQKSVGNFSSPPAPPPHLSAAMTAHHHHPWSVEVLNTSRTAAHPLGGRGNIRRSHDPLASPTLGANGVRTLYEAMRRGRDINPLGPCLGYRATRYIFMKFLDIRYAYPDSHFNPRFRPIIVAATVVLPRPTFMGAMASAWRVWMHWQQGWKRAARI